MNTEREIEIFVPGRLCLFGEHSDWAGRYTDINAEIVPGQAIVTGIDLGIYALVSKNNVFSISSINENGDTVSFCCDMDLNTLRENAEKSQFFSYACGVAAYIQEHYQIGGVCININKVTLPIKKGLSSSAATCVLVARAFNELYQLKMSINGEMQAAYRGELLTSSRCGRLDQACAYGVRAVCIEFSGDNISVEKLKVGRDFFWVFADLNSKKNTLKILSDLHKAYPFASTEQDKIVQEALGKDNRKIIAEATKLLSCGSAEELGKLMTRAQKLFDDKVAPACPSELTAPKLHSLLNDETVKSLSYGAKGVGSQGDGAIQILAKDKETQEKIVEYLRTEWELQAFTFRLRSSDRVRKAIIPIAGFGTRMYPATRFVKKEFLPVVDEKGIAKPVIMYLLEELYDAEIEEIILIVGSEELEQIKSMFKEPLNEQHMEKLPERVLEYERKIAKIGKRVKFAVQEERKGFGHAVYQARQFLDNEPVLLMLGDFIYKSNMNTSCVLQTIKAYRKSGGQLTVAIKETPVEDVVHYGILSGTFGGVRDYLMEVDEIVEKPTVEYAKDYLGVKQKNTVKYYSTFGQYVLTNKVFDFLEEDIARHDSTDDKSEIQLTSALQKVLERDGMTGVLIDGKSFDVGIPSAYMETITEFGTRCK